MTILQHIQTATKNSNSVQLFKHVLTYLFALYVLLIVIYFMYLFTVNLSYYICPLIGRICSMLVIIVLSWFPVSTEGSVKEKSVVYH